jgi:glycerol-3-phosphate acyltransferase PlsY
MQWMFLVGIAIGGYLIGSIPFGVLIAKSRGIDIREHGSGNIGATNVLRIVGKPWGVACFLLDFLKGLGSVLMAWSVAGAGGSSVAGIVGAVACIVGHNYPVWLKFKGGKGIAASGGALFGLLPVTALLLLVLWVAVFLTTRYVSLASLAVGVALPVIVFVFVQTGFRADWPLFYFAFVVGVMAVWRHRTNIQRLMDGTEHRFERRRKV